MKISGFQKMTLLDFPGKVACTIFTAGCNFRCGFCHNAALVTHIDNDSEFSEQEVLSYLSKRKGILEGVCITGGEPLLQPGIEDFLRKVKELGFLVKLDTNGSFPKKLKSIVADGLVDYVAMDIKNSREKYNFTADCTVNIDDIEESIAFLMSGAVDYEFRTTVVNEYHNIEDMKAIGEWIRGAEKYFLQNFVDSGDLIKDGLSSVNSTQLYKMQQILNDFVGKTEIRGI